MKTYEWRGDSKKEFLNWPLKTGVRASIFDRIRSLQEERRDVQGVKWMSGFDGHVAEIKISGFRVIVYCAYDDCVYMLSAFKKDSAHGIKTRKHEVNLIKKRLKDLRDERGSPTRRELH